MNTIQQGIILLLKSAITGESYPLPDGFSIEAACPIIKKQGLITLAYDGAVRCGISRKEPAMEELFRSYYAVLLRSERQMVKVNQIFEKFEEAGIDYLPFKGCVMKQLYPKPELRVMGDADILIRMPQYECIKPILETLGFVLKQESDCELVWTCPELYMELHRRMVQPSQMDYDAYFGDGWSRAVQLNGYRYTFSPEDMYIYLFMHFTKHYRCGGIGCRHVVDIWVYRRANPGMQEEYINRELEKLNLRQFHENFLRMLDVWFGDGQPDEITEFIAKRIFSGGSWGSEKDYHVFLALQKTKKPERIKNSRLFYTLRMLFPPLQQMRKTYPMLDHFPVLLPIAWLMRGIRVLLYKRKKIGKVVKTGKLISDQALQSHQEGLRMVGLEWHGQEYQET